MFSLLFGSYLVIFNNLNYVQEFLCMNKTLVTHAYRLQLKS